MALLLALTFHHPCCRLLGHMDTGGLNNYMATISPDGRWVAAGTFTSDVKVYEVAFDRLGAFTGIKLAMALKGHKSKASVGK